MKKNLFSLIVFLSIIWAQDRTAIFYATANDPSEGYDIIYPNAISQRFPVSTPLYDNYFLEKLGFYYSMVSESANIQVSIHDDELSMPGNIIATWPVTLIGSDPGRVEYYQIDTETECNYLYEDNYYWLSLKSLDTDSHIKWLHSASSYYTVSTSENDGDNWQEPTTTYAGGAKVYAEAIYSPEIDNIAGDVNFDNIANVLDVIMMVSYVLGDSAFNQNQISSADLNTDFVVNILDVVSLVDIILNEPPIDPNTNWELTDQNPNSDSFNQPLSPESFNGKVSAYYFGKAG